MKTSKTNNFAGNFSWRTKSLVALMGALILAGGCKKPASETALIETADVGSKNIASVSALVSVNSVGSGWVQYSPTKKIHLDDAAGLQIFNWTAYQSVGSPICADYSYNSTAGTETFRIVNNQSNRSEIRLLNDYSTGSRQFEGYVKFSSPLNDESLFQIFGSTSGATQLMIRGFSENNGSIKLGSTVLASNIYGQEVRVNVIHLQENVGNKFLVYINGVKKAELADNEAVTNYMKYGNYGTLTTGTATVQWRDVKIYQNGTAPAAQITLHQGCSYGGWSASFGVGNYTMSQLEAMGAVNDDASSIKVPAGLKVTIYENNNYGGNSAVITSDQSCLTDISFNDDISSIKVSTN
jgi:hypothetical protein